MEMLTGMTGVIMGTRQAYIESDWPLISICSGTDDFYNRLRIISRSECFGKALVDLGVDALTTEIITHWSTEG